VQWEERNLGGWAAKPSLRPRICLELSKCRAYMAFGFNCPIRDRPGRDRPRSGILRQPAETEGGTRGGTGVGNFMDFRWFSWAIQMFTITASGSTICRRLPWSILILKPSSSKMASHDQAEPARAEQVLSKMRLGMAAAAKGSLGSRRGVIEPSASTQVACAGVSRSNWVPQACGGHELHGTVA
jgi:hypothetical protein